MASSMAGGGDELADLVARVDAGEVAELLVHAAEVHEDVARTVRLASSVGGADRVSSLRIEVDRALRTRRFLGYWESSRWATEARPVVDALSREVDSSPSLELVSLLARAESHLVKVILHADDSNGMIGDLARDVLELHARSCEAGFANQLRLAKWMVRFTFDDQDFFMVDPVRYAGALGQKGLAAYRREVAKRIESAEGGRLFAGSYALERLAVLDRDAPRLVELLGGDLRNPYQFSRVAEAMIEIGDNDAALTWARRGITETDGWQVGKLYDLVAQLLAGRGETAAVLETRREQHRRLHSSSTYAVLRSAAVATDCWDVERAPARGLLETYDPGGLIDVLLGDGEPETAWTMAASHPDWMLGDRRWQQLAEGHEVRDPAAAMEVYLRLAGSALTEANRNAYQAGCVISEQPSGQLSLPATWRTSVRTLSGCANNTAGDRP